MPGKSLVLLIIMFMCISISCAHKQNVAYNSLVVSKETYDTTLKMAADLYKQNRISEKVKEEIIDKGRIYVKVHNAAVNALLVYEDSKSNEDQEKYLRLTAQAAELLADLLNYLPKEE